MSTPADPLERPLRRDAQRNLERIRVAAIKVFREQGLKASHEAIAREADVSIGTVYRRFPDRDQLIDILFEQELDAVLAVADEALAMEDRWQGVVHLFECGMELAACNVGLAQLLTGSQHGAERVERVRERLSPKAREVIERARARRRDPPRRRGVRRADDPPHAAHADGRRARARARRLAPLPRADPRRAAPRRAPPGSAAARDRRRDRRPDRHGLEGAAC